MEAQRAPRPLARVRDADPRGRRDRSRTMGPRARSLDEQTIARHEILSVERTIDRERLAELAGPRAEVAIALHARAARTHRVDALGRLERANEDRDRIALGARDDV